MVARVGQVTIDVGSVTTMAAFWAEALGYTVDSGDDGSAKLLPPAGAPPSVPMVWLQAVGTPKHDKNRVHLDLVSDGDPEAEVRRLVGLGARRINIGQRGDEGFVVLADPDGNEFCVLDHRPDRS
jgi:hypothetical protein